MREAIFLPLIRATSMKLMIAIRYRGIGSAPFEDVDRKFLEHYSSVMKNVTIPLEPEVARWARVYAAQHDTSVSRLLGEMLKQKMREERGYEAAMQAYFSLPRTGIIRQSGQIYPSRDEAHER